MGSQRYSATFKQTVVEALLAGSKRPAQLCREHGLDFGTIRKWRAEYEAHGSRAWSGERARQDPSTEAQIADLERLVGQLTVENRVLKKALQQAASRSTAGTRLSRNSA
ncbi:MAG: transposase [Chloroflexota bacterium]